MFLGPAQLKHVAQVELHHRCRVPLLSNGGCRAGPISAYGGSVGLTFQWGSHRGDPRNGRLARCVANMSAITAVIVFMFVFSHIPISIIIYQSTSLRRDVPPPSHSRVRRSWFLLFSPPPPSLANTSRGWIFCQFSYTHWPPPSLANVSQGWNFCCFRLPGSTHYPTRSQMRGGGISAVFCSLPAYTMTSSVIIKPVTYLSYIVIITTWNKYICVFFTFK